MILEVCVDRAQGLRAAVAGGADRIELCSALALGGLTPGAGLMALAAQVQRDCGVAMMAMIRAEPGGFCLTAEGLCVARADIAAARAAGLAGVVIGASLPDGRLDGVALAALVTEAAGLDVTLHRCFDLVPDQAEALALLRRLGIGRVLTSGGAPNVVDGLARLGQAVRLAENDIVIMPGSGISAQTAAPIRALGVREVHASCAAPVPQPAELVTFGFAPAALRITDVGQVRALKAALA